MKLIRTSLCLLLCSGAAFAHDAGTDKVYKIWDDEPCPNRGHDYSIKKARGYPFDEDWETKSYPIGNGYMGANLFGRTDTDRIQITDKTLANEGLYNLSGMTSFAEVYLDLNHPDPTNYSRTLSLNDATHRVSYQYEGVEYQQVSFASYPDNVLVVQLSADQPGKVSFTVRPEIPYLREASEKYARSGTVVALDDLITLSGTIPFFSVNYEAQIKVLNSGGSLSAGADTITVSNADSVVLLIAVGTNYELSSRIFSESIKNKKLDAEQFPHEEISARIGHAVGTGFDQLRANHLADYQNLFNRTTIDFDSEVAELPTKALLRNYQEGETNPYLEELMLQYGRYLLIASSRPGTLPTGLQGVWSQYEVTPWTGGYWHNINVQMNYWGAFSADLAETFVPYIEYFQAYWPEAKKNATNYVRKNNPDALTEDNGWTIGTSGSPYVIHSPGGHSGPGTAGFTSKLFWEYYDFTRDENFLRETGYPALLGTSRFLSKTVKPTDDGLLLVDPSASPEQKVNGKEYITVGTTFDQGFVWENHNDVLKAAEILGAQDPHLAVAKEQMSKLDPILVGASGQIKEFREENMYGDLGEKKHRHVSHLCPLYPGTLINSETPEWMQATIVSLDARGNNTTGWAMAHRMNLRARTKDGDKAYEVYKKLIQERTYENLWTTHPPFQIDSNFGCMAGVAEMLLQSHEGYIEPLAALPSVWPNGNFSGLVARGNFVFSSVWKNGKATSFEILSRSGGPCEIKYPGIAEAQLTDTRGKAIEFTKKAEDRITFNTVKGTEYRITLP
ncbi:glycoside hydrolase family 95 protein [Pontiellaceae bacterium B1224]|nr:glycoside hydrolase family 95 protein [Pontiellaceae bacterium B1224]